MRGLQYQCTQVVAHQCTQVHNLTLPPFLKRSVINLRQHASLVLRVFYEILFTISMPILLHYQSFHFVMARTYEKEQPQPPAVCDHEIKKKVWSSVLRHGQRWAGCLIGLLRG